MVTRNGSQYYGYFKIEVYSQHQSSLSPPQVDEVRLITLSVVSTVGLIIFCGTMMGLAACFFNNQQGKNKCIFNKRVNMVLYQITS